MKVERLAHPAAHCSRSSRDLLHQVLGMTEVTSAPGHKALAFGGQKIGLRVFRREFDVPAAGPVRVPPDLVLLPHHVQVIEHLQA